MTHDLHIEWEVVARGIVAPEGPAVDRLGNVTLVSRWTGKVVRVDSHGVVQELVQTKGKPQSVAYLPDGGLLLADAVRRALLRIDDRQLAIVCDQVDGQPLAGPNDLVVASNDVVYLTDPGMDMQAAGRVLRVDLTTGRASVLVDGLLFPNGITLSGDGRTLFVAESTPHRVWRYELLDDGRRLGPGEVFHEFHDFYPDGIAFDSTGRLLVALCGGGVLAVLSPEGELVASIDAGGASCTNCVFGGDDFQTLYMTEDKQEALLRMRWPVAGQRRFSRSQS